MKTNKISIIGAGNVGAATGFSLMLNKVASTIVFYDIDEKRAQGEALDIFQGTSFIAPVDVHAGTIEDTKDSDIVIITAGVSQKVGETRLDLVNRNIAIYRKLIPEIVKYNPNAILLVVSNPVDILTHVTWKISGFPKERVIGSGTVLDTSRLKSILSRELNIDSRNIHGYVIGEHGDTEIVVYSKAHIGGVSFNDYYRGTKRREKDFKERIADEVREAAYKIIAKKGYTNYAVAVAVSRICTAILRDERSILTTSTYLNGEYHVEDVYLSTPTIIGRGGAVSILELELSPEEQYAFEESASMLKKILKESEL